MTLQEEVLAFFESQDTKYLIKKGEEGEPDNIHIIVNGDHGNWEGIALCYEQERFLVFYVNLGMKVPQEKKQALAEWLFEKNYYYKYGGYYIDPPSGTLVVRNSVHVYGTKKERGMLIRQGILTGAVMADQDYEEIMKFMYA